MLHNSCNQIALIEQSSFLEGSRYRQHSINAGNINTDSKSKTVRLTKEDFNLIT